MPMGGSLSRRLKARNYDTREIEVNIHRLSQHLDEPVDFLKLDIEGPEDRVLAECGDKLRMVKNLFCEFHYGIDLPQKRLGKILNLLDRKGFDVRIDQSLWGHRAGAIRPMSVIDIGSSLGIWAKQRK